MYVPVMVKLASLRWSNKTSQNQIKPNDIRNNKEGALWPENNPEILSVWQYRATVFTSTSLLFNIQK